MKSVKRKNKIISIGLAVLLFLCCSCGTEKLASDEDLDNLLKTTEQYLTEAVASPTGGSSAGDWIVFDRGRLGQKQDDTYGQTYCDNLRGMVKSGHGVIAEGEATDYARAVMALSALGKDVENVEGYNLLAKLDDRTAVINQGLNGPVFALIAANTSGSNLKNEGNYKQYILDAQLKDGGFTFAGKKGDVDMTAMAIQSLAPYKEEPEVKTSVDKALKFLAGYRKEKGEFGSCESVSQVIIALCTLGEDPMKENSVIDEGQALTGELMDFRESDGFAHKKGDDADSIATQQAYTALTAIKIQKEGKSLYEQ